MRQPMLEVIKGHTLHHSGIIKMHIKARDVLIKRLWWPRLLIFHLLIDIYVHVTSPLDAASGHLV